MPNLPFGRLQRRGARPALVRPVGRGAALALLFAACNDTAQEPFDDPSLDIVAEVAADAALEDLAFMNEAIPVGGSALVQVPGQGTEHERTVTWFDGDGQEMDAYDPLLTARLEWTHRFTVQMGRGPVSGEMVRNREMVVSGLLGTETTRTHNGLGTDDRNRVFVNPVHGERTYDMSATVTIVDVVIAVDREAQPWPLSGTITRQLIVEVGNGPQGDVHREQTTVITFDGTRYPTMTLNGVEYEIDLDAPPGWQSSRRRP
jgi:hypothetical protein